MPVTVTTATTGTAGSAASWRNPERSGTLRRWYDETNHVYRHKHGSDPTSETDGNAVVEG